MAYCEHHGDYVGHCFGCSVAAAKFMKIRVPPTYVPPTVEGWERVETRYAVRWQDGDRAPCVAIALMDDDSVEVRTYGALSGGAAYRDIPISILADLVHAWEARRK